MAKDTNFQPIFDYIDKNNATIAKVVEERLEQNNVELLEKFQQMVKEEINNVDVRLDGIVKLVKKLDEERLFSVEWLRRIESEVDRIKKHLQIV